VAAAAQCWQGHISPASYGIQSSNGLANGTAASPEVWGTPCWPAMGQWGLGWASHVPVNKAPP